MTLLKASEEEGKWIMYLEASNEALDQEDESVLQKALKDAAPYYLEHGNISWDHKHKDLKTDFDPKYIIGEPLDVAFTDDTRQTLVKGVLYKYNKLAQSLMDNLMSGSTRFGSSVGGYTLHKDELRKSVDQVYWDEIAITWKPVNDLTLGTVGLVPYREFVKALTAGSGVDASTYTGGRALISEYLQGAVPGPPLSEGQVRILFDNVLDAATTGEIVSFNDLVAFVLAKGY
ncbi:MAG: hypothetical protein ACREHG_00855, partial [Candidatus Saccharimonadales bacterium]